MRSILIMVALIWPFIGWSQSCAEQSIKFQVLGSGGPELTDGRVSSSYLVWVGGKATVLVDAGSGSAHQFEISGAQSEDLQAILLTHLHVDHSADFPAYIKDSYFTQRTNDLWVFGPKGNDRMPSTSVFVDRLFGLNGAYAYLKRYHLADARSSYKIKTIDASLNYQNIQKHRFSEKISFSSIGVHHGPISAVGWRVDIGDCAISFTGDMTNKYNSMAQLAAGSDLLVANNTIHEAATDRAKNMHLAPSEISKIAIAAKVKKLLLAHLMNSSLPYLDETTALIKQDYTGPVVVAEDLMVVELGDEELLKNISELHWKNRIIVLNEMDNQQATIARLKSQQADIEERHILWFVLAKNKTFTNFKGRITESFAEQLRAQYGLQPGQVILVGKDGGLKSSFRGINLNAIFADIDAMPMRQNEMQQ